MEGSSDKNLYNLHVLHSSETSVVYNQLYSRRDRSIFKNDYPSMKSELLRRTVLSQSWVGDHLRSSRCPATDIFPCIIMASDLNDRPVLFSSS